MSQSEKLQIDYGHVIDYDIDPQNQVGTDEDFLSLYPTKTPVRTIPTPSGTTYHVRKFGKSFSETDVTTIDAPSANLTVKVYALDGTLLGSRANGGAFVSESTASTEQGIYITFTASGGATIPTSLNATFPNAGTISLKFTAETLVNLDVFTFYMSETGSSYYDSAMIYGGERHTATGAESLPDFKIATCYARLSANDGVQIDDSETYDEDLTTDNQALDTANTYLFSKLNETPTITRGVGARVTREVSQQYNNLTAIYFNENGSDSDDGTWQNPKLTIANAITNRGSKHVVYGGSGATVSGGEFNENVTINGSFNLESDIGYIVNIWTITGDTITLTSTQGNLYGVYVSESHNRGIKIDVNSYSGNIHDCSSITKGDGLGNTLSITNVIADIYNCIVLGDIYGINLYNCGAININNCICTGQYTSISVSGSPAFGGIIKNCVLYNSNTIGGRGISLEADGFSGAIDNCTIFNSYYGISYYAYSGAFTGTIRNCIIYSNIIDLHKDVSSASIPIISYSNYSINSGWTISTGCITTDPKFISIATSHNLAISANSGACHTGSASDNMGFNHRAIEIDNSDIEINGIIIDMNNDFSTAIFIRDTADHTGLIVKYCDIKNCQGIAIDLYDDATNIDSEITNNIIQSNGNGLRLGFSGNTVNENIIRRNTIFGIWSDYSSQVFNHNVIYNNKYGIYLESNSSALIKNCIFDNNTLYAIYSEVVQIITYCCITGAVNSNVDKTDSSNIINTPLFIDTTTGGEDFRLKSNYNGNIVESKCIDASDDTTFPDMGVYDELRTISEDSWKKYTVAYNPTTVNEESNIKGTITADDIFGNLSTYMTDDKIVLPLDWDGSSASNKEQYLKIKYLQSLIPSAKNELLDEDCEQRIHLVPSTFYGTGTGTVDSIAKTITDSGWVENEKKGWQVTLKFKTGTGSAISASGKTLTKVGDFTGEDWTGYYLYILGHYFYIKSNTDDVLTLSDPNGYLTDKTAYAYTLTKYFHVLRNTETILYLTDTDSELITGSYDYFFDFILCRVIPNNINTIQTYFDYLNFDNKNSYGITYEGID